MDDLSTLDLDIELLSGLLSDAVSDSSAQTLTARPASALSHWKNVLCTKLLQQSGLGALIKFINISPVG